MLNINHQTFKKLFIKQLFNYKMLAFLALFASVVTVNNTFAADKPITAPADKNSKIINIHAGDQSQVLVTTATTVRQALKNASIEIDEQHDLVEPELNAELVDSKYNINVYRAKPVTIVDGNIRRRLVTAFQTPEQILQAAGVNFYKEDKLTMYNSIDLLLDGIDTIVNIERAKKVNLILYGEKLTIRSHRDTVAELFEDQKIHLQKDDFSSIASDQKITNDMAIEVYRNGIQTISEDQDVPFSVDHIQDADKNVGYREIKQAGKNGRKKVTYELLMKNGKEVSRKEISSVITEEPHKQIEIVGIKNNYSESLNQWLQALRTCETHGNYRAATGNGYYGAYQFMPSTWNNIARRTGRHDLVGVRPDQASPADQDAMVVANANATAGLSTQHPGCYRKLGLSNKPPVR